MSTIVSRSLECTCGASFDIEVGLGLHGSRLPLIRTQILAGDFHRFTCPECGLVTCVEVELIYTDFSRGHYIAAVPPGVDLDAASHRHRALFDRYIGAHGFDFRVVCGRDGLRETLLAWEFGFDDRALAELKADVADSTPLVAPLSIAAMSATRVVFRDDSGNTWPVHADLVRELAS